MKNQREVPQDILDSANNYANSTFQNCSYHYDGDQRLTDFDARSESYQHGGAEERAKQEEDKVKMLEWMVSELPQGDYIRFTRGKITSSQLITKYEEHKASLTEKSK